MAPLRQDYSVQLPWMDGLASAAATTCIYGKRLRHGPLGQRSKMLSPQTYAVNQNSRAANQSPQTRIQGLPTECCYAYVHMYSLLVVHTYLLHQLATPYSVYLGYRLLQAAEYSVLRTGYIQLRGNYCR